MHIKSSMDNFAKIGRTQKGGHREDTDLAQLNCPWSNSGITIKILWRTTLNDLKNSQDFLTIIFLAIFIQPSHFDKQRVTTAPSSDALTWQKLFLFSHYTDSNRGKQHNFNRKKA